MKLNRKIKINKPNSSGNAKKVTVNRNQGNDRPKGVQNTPNSNARSAVRSGKALQSKLADERAANEAYKQRRNAPMRFFVPYNTTKEGIILDNDIFSAGVLEHCLQDPQTQRYNIFELCVAETEICPLCSMGNHAAWVMLLTVLDLSPYTTKKGKHVPFSKKLLVIKQSNAAVFNSIQQRQNGLRGCHLDFVRGGDKSPSIGTPNFVKKYSESELVSKYNTPEIKENGRVIRTAGHFLRPFNYDEVFVLRTAEELRRIYGGEPPLGSAESNFEGSDDDSSVDNLPF